MRWAPGMVLLLVVTNGAIAEAPSKPSQHRTDHSYNHDTNSNSDRQISPYEQFPFPMVPIVPALAAFNSPEDLTHANSEEHSSRDQAPKRNDEGPRWTDVVVAIFTIVLGAAAIASGIIAYFQWQALRAQEARLKEFIDKAEASSKQQSVEMQASIAHAGTAAFATERSADAIGDSARFTEEIALGTAKTARIMGDMAERQLRAYIAASVEEHPDVDSNDFIRAVILIKNHGQTPAMDCVHIGCIGVGAANAGDAEFVNGLQVAKEHSTHASTIFLHPQAERRSLGFCRTRL